MDYPERKQPPPSPSTRGEIDGLPTSLPAGTIAALIENGKAVAIATDDHLTIYSLTLGERATARRSASHHLHGRARALADSGLGLLIGTEKEGHSELWLLHDRELVLVLRMHARVTALVAAGAYAYAVLVSGGERVRLVQINLRQREIVTEVPLEHEQVKLSVNRSGQHVVIADRRARTVTSLGQDLKPRSAPGQPSRGRSEDPSSDTRHDAGCCCVCCKPPSHAEPHPGEDRPKPDRPGGDHPGSDHPGMDHPGADHPGGHRPGDVGVHADDDGTVVGNGGRVDHYPPANVHRPPCGRGLFYTVADLQRVGAYVLASDRTARHVALLSADMNLLNEWRFGRGGAMLLSAEGAPNFIMHVRESGKWTFHDPFEVATVRRPDLDLFPYIQPETKTFVGQQTYALSHGQQPSPTEIKAVLLPIIEGSQSFHSPNLNGFAGFMNRTMVPQVIDFYDENSFGMLKNVSVAVFGVDANLVPGSGPLKLPRLRLAEYFWPPYVPARLELVETLTPVSQIVLDGRESLTIDVRPRTGGAAGGQMTLPFFALGFERDDPNPVSQVKFLGTESLTLWVTLPDGTAKVLTLTFSAKTFDFLNDAGIPGALTALETYLDGIMHAAETAAGIGARLFAVPKARRIRPIGGGFGRLLVTFAAANLSGNKLRVTATSSSHPGGDPMGLNNPIRGFLQPWETGQLNRLLKNSALVAQDNAGIVASDRRLSDPSSVSSGSNLVTTISISDLHGGPGAAVNFVSATDLSTLFDTATPQPNSQTTKNDAEALRDVEDFFRDVYSAANQRLRDAGKSTDALKGFGCVMIVPIEPATHDPANPNTVSPSEAWSVSPLGHPPLFNVFRGYEQINTIRDRKDDKIQLQSAWTLIFLANGIPDNPLIFHELGHAIGLGDLYKQDNYRDELAYLSVPGDNTVSWAMMCWHPPMTHHCGYHKLQMNWIDDGAGTEKDYGRVFPFSLPNPSATWTKEILLVPIELWRNSLPGSARAAFGVGPDFPVVQLGHIDFGGDGSVFGLIEARQPGAHFSKHLPGGGGVIITNCISWTRDERIVIAGQFRRSAQLLNPDNILRNPGDSFDLAFAPELAVKGIKVEIVDKKTVEGDAQVYRVKVKRENAEFADLFFEPGDPYWKSPDLWVDWMGNNLRDAQGKPIGFSDKPEHHDIYGLGQPTDQGEKIRVQPQGAVTPDNKPKFEAHWLIGRVRNRGTIKAVDVKVNFYYYDPPGGGDAGKPMNILSMDRYKLIGTKFEEVLGRDDPAYGPKDILMRWDVPPGFKGHTCLYVHIADLRVEEDSGGAVLGTPDIWGLNNAAQKNVDDYEVLSGSPFEPVEFDFSVHNAGPVPEHAYIEPDGLPHGMELTVTPPWQHIPSGKTGIFHCTLTLDERIIRTGCENDQRFRIHAWRQDSESSARWGGVEYQIRPREKTKTELRGSWDSATQVTLKGKVTPAPGGGLVRIRLDFEGQQATWVSTNATPIGDFTWTGPVPAGSDVLYAIASFEGNRKFGSSLSNPVTLTAYPILH